ncbi:MAG: M48 family metalloprotease [Pseudomonadota bacterium]
MGVLAGRFVNAGAGTMLAFLLLIASPVTAYAGLLDSITESISNFEKEVSAKEEKQHLPLDKEKILGREVASQLLGALPLVDDKEVQRYVNKVGVWVAQQSSRPEIGWHFGVLDSDAINAFAAPGGYVFITRGLFSLMQSEAELAGVLGHEIAHVTARHHLSAMETAQKTQENVDWWAEALNAEDSETYKKVSGKVANVLLSGLDQDSEKEADRIGVVLAARAGYDPFSLFSVLTTIGHLNPQEANMQLLSSTHPHSDVRIDSLDYAIGDRFDRVADQAIVEDRFLKMKRRLENK